MSDKANTLIAVGQLMLSFQRDAGMNKREWLLKRNCSLSPRQSVAALTGLCLGLFILPVPLLLVLGAWPVFAFAILEAVALAAASLHYARHACDHEHIVLADGALLVERIEAEKVEKIRLEPRWTRVVPPRRYGDLVGLESGRDAVLVGRFITAEKRRLFAEELRHELRK